MKKLRCTALVLTICVLLTAGAPAAHAIADPPNVSAVSVVLADLNSGEVIFSKNMDEQRAPASLTKIMTVLVAIEQVEAGRFAYTDMVTAQEDCRNGMDSDSSTADIYPGEEMPLQELMYCAMLASANEACNIIAEYMAGSVDAYVNWMNDKAEQLGCTNTHFANTNGLTSQNHYSSAADLALITREASTHEVFMTMCNSITHTVPATNASEARELKSTNALISPDGLYGDQYLFKGAAGVKTGHTNAAGFCLISTATRDVEGEPVGYLCIVLGSEGDFEKNIFKNFEDSISLYKWAFGNYKYFLIRTVADGITKAEVDLAKDGEMAILRPEKDIRLLLPKDYDESQLEIQTVVYESELTAPIPAGTVLGEAEVFINGKSYGRTNLITSVDIEMSKGEVIKRQFRAVTESTWFKLVIGLFVAILVAYFLLVARYRKLRQKQLKDRKAAEMKRRQDWQRRYEEQNMERRRSYDEPVQRYSRERSGGFDDRYDRASENTGRSYSRRDDGYGYDYDDGRDSYGGRDYDRTGSDRNTRGTGSYDRGDYSRDSYGSRGSDRNDYSRDSYSSRDYDRDIGRSGSKNSRVDPFADDYDINDYLKYFEDSDDL